MMNLDYNTIGQIIKDVDKSIDLHQKASVLYPNCNCKELGLKSGCFYCKLIEAIDDLSCLKSHLNPLSKNVVNSIHFIDVESFCYSLGSQGHVDSIDIQPKWKDDPDPNSDHIPDQTPDPDQKPIGFDIFVTTSRYAMDGNGSHVGYEVITYRWKAYSKRELGITGIPYLLSSWVVNPNEYKIDHGDLPPEDVPEHDSDCEFKQTEWIVRVYNQDKEIDTWTIDRNRNSIEATKEAESDIDKLDSEKFTDWTLKRDDELDFSNCECAEFFEGYWHPEDDFFYQEMESSLE